MTNQQKTPKTPRPTQRYKIGYHSDEWGVRSNTPDGIPDPAGSWVRYKDHVAALAKAQQPTQAQAAAVPLTDEQIVGVMHSIPINAAPSYHIAFARAIEQAHGIKGGQHGTE